MNYIDIKIGIIIHFPWIIIDFTWNLKRPSMKIENNRPLSLKPQRVRILLDSLLFQFQLHFRIGLCAFQSCSNLSLAVK